ncbi:unnamed protein product [Nesidiocoris tenuis]|uniref:Uncharacterized protein n=1 Tax=Nesidiocoris tenuis TaxID=355587 RepID=A0A6H5HPS6_9HEMI|nr:unnamed protein product [Nesidiocoris tenuis]
MTASMMVWMQFLVDNIGIFELPMGKEGQERLPSPSLIKRPFWFSSIGILASLSRNFTICTKERCHWYPIADSHQRKSVQAVDQMGRSLKRARSLEGKRFGELICCSAASLMGPTYLLLDYCASDGNLNKRVDSYRGCIGLPETTRQLTYYEPTAMSFDVSPSESCRVAVLQCCHLKIPRFRYPLGASWLPVCDTDTHQHLHHHHQHLHEQQHHQPLTPTTQPPPPPATETHQHLHHHPHEEHHCQPLTPTTTTQPPATDTHQHPHHHHHHHHQHLHEQHHYQPLTHTTTSIFIVLHFCIRLGDSSGVERRRLVSQSADQQRSARVSGSGSEQGPPDHQDGDAGAIRQRPRPGIRRVLSRGVLARFPAGLGRLQERKRRKVYLKRQPLMRMGRRCTASLKSSLSTLATLFFLQPPTTSPEPLPDDIVVVFLGRLIVKS